MKTIHIALFTLILLIFTQCDDSVSNVNTPKTPTTPTEPVVANSEIIQVADSILGKQAKSTKFKLSDYYQSSSEIVIVEFSSEAVNVMELGDEQYQLSQPDSVIGKQLISGRLINENSDTLDTELTYIIQSAEDSTATEEGDSTETEAGSKEPEDAESADSDSSTTDDPASSDPINSDPVNTDGDLGSDDTEEFGAGNTSDDRGTDTTEENPTDDEETKEPVTDPEPTELVIMPLGDSMTNDSRSRVQLWNLLVDDGHDVDFVGDQKQNSSIPDADHEGVGGIKIRGIADKIESLIQKYDPQYVNLMVGTNDIAWYFSETGEEIANRWNNLVQQIYDNASSDTYIIAATIPPTTSKNVGSSSMTTKDRVDLIAEYNAAIRELVKQRKAAGDLIVLADMAKALNVNDHVSGDGVHLNDAGYAKMGTVYYEAIKSTLD